MPDEARLITHNVDNQSGYDAAKFLRTKRHGLPVLMVGGLIDDDRLQYRLTLEGLEVFPKPFTADELLAKVKAVLTHN